MVAGMRYCVDAATTAVLGHCPLRRAGIGEVSLLAERRSRSFTWGEEVKIVVLQRPEQIFLLWAACDFLWYCPYVRSASCSAGC